MVIQITPGNGASDEVWVVAQDFRIATGSPSNAVQNDWPVWVFDAATAERVSATVGAADLEGWSTYDVELWWTNAGAGSGDVVWIHRAAQVGDGSTLTAVSGGTTQTLTAPAQDVVEVTAFASGLSVTAGQPLLVHILRNGGAGGDTLGNDASLLAVRLTKAS